MVEETKSIASLDEDIMNSSSRAPLSKVLANNSSIKIDPTNRSNGASSEIFAPLSSQQQIEDTSSGQMTLTAQGTLSKEEPLSVLTRPSNIMSSKQISEKDILIANL